MRTSGESGHNAFHVGERSRESAKALWAKLPMLPTALQPEAAAQHADAPLDARPKPVSPPNPDGPLIGHPGRERLTRLRDDQACHPGLLGDGFISGGIDPAVGSQHVWRSAKAPLVGHETVGPIGEILARFGEDAVTTEDAPFDLLSGVEAGRKNGQSWCGSRN